MTDEDAESRFAEFLRLGGFEAPDRDVPVGKGDVDFGIRIRGQIALWADVKVVRDPEIDDAKDGKVLAKRNIRGDIKKLREKFSAQPSLPVVLVTLNGSRRIFTGFTVASAMLGDEIFEFSRGDSSREIRWNPFHRRRNARMTRNINTSISGIMLLGPHRPALFSNPHAAHEIPDDLLDLCDVIRVDPRTWADDRLHEFMFWPVENSS